VILEIKFSDLHIHIHIDPPEQILNQLTALSAKLTEATSKLETAVKENS